jgi:hypothetical protein
MRNNQTILGAALIVLAATLALSSLMERNASAGVGTWSITRAGSSIGIDSTGQVNLVPLAGKGTKIGTGGAPVKKILSATASVDFTALAAGACETFTITVTGAADGDSVSMGVPAAAWNTTEYATIQGFVSGADTVKVKRCNLTNATTALSNPAAVTVRATVFQF